MLNIETVKQNIIKKLKPLHPNKIILFGSYAYGMPNENSDLDILVIMNNYKNKWDEKEKIRKVLRDIRIPKDILVENENFFLSHSTDDWINTALYDAKHKGVLLYG